ncbi:MAG: HEAT repeat domain-containing protein [Anaerolineae bacterium]|jgi:HEAT repeat protein
MSFLRKLLGPPNVEKLKDRVNVQGLIKALGYQEDSRVRRGAAAALGELGDRRAVVPLTGALHDEHSSVRRTAVEALGEIGDPQALEPLVTILKDEDANGVKKATAEALGKIGNPRAVEPLLIALRDQSWAIRRAAAEALDQLDWQPTRDEVGAAYWLGKHRWDRCVEVGSPAVEPLIAALRKRERRGRKPAARALGEIGDERAVEPLIDILTSYRYSDVRQAAAQALIEIGAPAVESLIATLKRNDKDARTAAMAALIEISGPAVEPLIAALEKGSTRVRKFAATTLSEIGDERALEALISTLGDRKASVRGHAARGLGKIRDERATRHLVACLQDEQEGVQAAAADALDALGWEPERDKLGATYWIARREWDRCAKIGEPAVDQLFAALKDNRAVVRRFAARVLTEIGGAEMERLVTALIELGAGDWRRQEQAIKSLAKIGDERAVEPLVALLDSRGSHVRRAAAEALGKIGDPRAVNALSSTLRDDEWPARLAAARALGRIRNAQAVAPLIATLKDEKIGVRRAAARALAQLYHDGGLDEQDRQAILARREAMAKPHTDERHENEKGCVSWHTDSGIGVTL